MLPPRGDSHAFGVGREADGVEWPARRAIQRSGGRRRPFWPRITAGRLPALTTVTTAPITAAAIARGLVLMISMTPRFATSLLPGVHGPESKEFSGVRKPINESPLEVRMLTC